MEFKDLDMTKVAAILISLLEEQEGVEIEYEFVRKEDETA